MSNGNRNNIVSLARHIRGQETAPQREVENYWNSLLRDGEIPMRSAVDPRAIQNALEYCFIAERVTSTMSRLRVTGNHLSDLMGMSVCGMPLACLFNADARKTLADATDKLFNEPAIIHMEISSEGPSHMTGDLVLLPMRSDLGDVTRSLGCMVTHGRIHRAPRRFDITNVRIRSVLFPDQHTEVEIDQMPKHTDLSGKPKENYLKLIISKD